MEAKFKAVLGSKGLLDEERRVGFSVEGFEAEMAQISVEFPVPISDGMEDLEIRVTCGCHFEFGRIPLSGPGIEEGPRRSDGPGWDDKPSIRKGFQKLGTE
jgi:hypothetical protein